MKRVRGRRMWMQAVRLFLVASLMLVAGLTVSKSMVASAATGACTTPSTDYGTVTSTVTIPSGSATASYRVWSRIAATDTTNDHFLLEVDAAAGTSCFAVGGTSSKPVPIYSSTDDANGTRFANDSTNWFSTDTSGASVSVMLPAGTTTFKLIGDAPGLVIDRVIFTQATPSECTPSGVGDNCITVAPTDNPPTGSISGPADGSTVTSPDIVVAASDDIAVTGVDIYEGTTRLGAATLQTGGTNSSLNGTWVYNWDTSSLKSASTHTLHAVITDGVNTPVNSNSVTLTIKDTIAPSKPVITAPAANSTQTGDFTATATSTDDVGGTGVSKMKYFIDGGATPVATATTAPFSKLIPTTGLSAGSHTLTARAYDANSNVSAVSAATTFTFNPQTSAAAPTVSISNVDSTTIISTDLVIAAGQPNDVLNSQTYTVSADPVDNSGTGIKQVVLALDGTTVGTQTTGFDFSVDVRSLSCGTHTFTATVTDKQSPSKTGTFSTTFKAARSADVNADSSCKVDLADYNAVRTSYGLTADKLANQRIDVNRNGVVDLIDYSSVRTKYGQ